MSWKAYEFNHTDRASIWAALQAFLIEIGWELHDNISATVKVYKSNGESGNEPYGYIWIDAGTSTYIEFAAYQYWDSAAHTGARKRWPNDTQSSSRITATYIGTAYTYTIFFGDKDIVGLMTYANYTSVSSVNQGIAFGHLHTRFDSVLIDADGTAGTAGTLSVATTSGIGVGKYIQICGGTTGCDLLQVSDLTSAIKIKTTALPRNYGTGAKIGSPASTFGIACPGVTVGQRWYPTSFYGDAGTTVSTGYVQIQQITSPSLYTYVSHFSKKYTAVPQIVAADSASSPGIMLGLINRNILYATYSYSYDCFIENIGGGIPTSGTTTSSTANTITDSSRSWAVNEHAGRFVIIVSGTGTNQVRKISSNTATELTVQSNWVTNPDLSSDYKICDVVWRCLPSSFLGNNNIVKITDTITPA